MEPADVCAYNRKTRSRWLFHPILESIEQSPQWIGVCGVPRSAKCCICLVGSFWNLIGEHQLDELDLPTTRTNPAHAHSRKWQHTEHHVLTLIPTAQSIHTLRCNLCQTHTRALLAKLDQSPHAAVLRLVRRSVVLRPSPPILPFHDKTATGNDPAFEFSTHWHAHWWCQHSIKSDISEVSKTDQDFIFLTAVDQFTPSGVSVLSAAFFNHVF